MAVKVDSSTWTGLSTERRVGDVRAAQRPVAGGAKPLTPQDYRHRLFNWPNLIFLLPIWLAISLTSDGGIVRAAWLAAVYLGLFVGISLFVHWRRRRSGTSTALRLDIDGLHLPMEFIDPIPWSRIGAVRLANGRLIGHIHVEIDPSHKLVRRPPWPFNAGKGATVEMPCPFVHLSTWSIDARVDGLIDDLERFRDNYCSE